MVEIVVRTEKVVATDSPQRFGLFHLYNTLFKSTLKRLDRILKSKTKTKTASRARACECIVSVRKQRACVPT